MWSSRVSGPFGSISPPFHSPAVSTGRPAKRCRARISERATKEKHETLRDIKLVCMVREIGWALLHTALNRTLPAPGTNYLDFSREVLESLQRGLVTLVD